MIPELVAESEILWCHTCCGLPSRPRHEKDIARTKTSTYCLFSGKLEFEKEP